MKNVQLKNIGRLFAFNMYTAKKAIIGWTIVIFSFMTLYMILFPSVQDLAQVKVEAMPKELLQFMGMDSMADLGNFSSYFSTIFGIVLIAVSIFAATFSASLIVKEEKTKSIEFLNSLAVSRTEIYISKYLVATVAVTIVLAGAMITTMLCGTINGGDTFVMADIIASAKITSFTALLFSGISLMLAGISPKIGTGAVCSSVVLASYMLGYLGELLSDDVEFLLYFSPFITISAQKAIALADETFIALAIYVTVYVVAVVIGGIAYNKRDFKI